jgi:tetratricopeptide (TPR) repeat protein
VDALVLAAMIESQRHCFPECEAFLRKALEIDPLHQEALIVLSKFLASRRRLPEGIAVAETAVLAYPEDDALLTHLGLLLVQANRFEDAAIVFRKASSLAPENPVYVRNLGSALKDCGREHEAIEAYQRSLKLDFRNLDCWMNLAKLLLAHGRFPEAVDAADAALKLNRLCQPAHLVKALALSENMQGDEAEPHLRRAVKLNPQDGLAHAALGYWLQEEGNFTESLAELEAAMQLIPDHGFAYYNYFRARKASDLPSGLLEDLERRVQKTALPPRDAAYMNYALGKAMEDLKDHQAAIHYFDRANDLAYGIWLGARPWDRSHYEHRFSRSMDTFTPEKLSELSSNGLETDQPLIIVGMMRSGTSLLEQILSSHPDVIGAGELPFWHDHEDEAYGDNFVPKADRIRRLGERYLESLQKFGKAKRITDKLPHNYAMLGLIHSAFPNARIIHVKRNGADNCLSIYTTVYQRPPVFAHHRDNIVFAYEQYRRIIAHWRETLPRDRFMEIQYEDLVENREPLTRSLIEFSGLNWNDACLHHEINDRIVRTPSLWQVRQPIYKTSMARWKRFEPWIPEFAALADRAWP